MDVVKWPSANCPVCNQVPVAVKGKDVTVSLKDQRCLDIQVSLGGRYSRRVDGHLRKAVKSFGNGSTWELITEGTCKACSYPHFFFVCYPLSISPIGGIFPLERIVVSTQCIVIRSSGGCLWAAAGHCDIGKGSCWALVDICNEGACGGGPAHGPWL